MRFKDLRSFTFEYAVHSGWVSQRPRQIIEFQNSEIISLMQSQGKKRRRLSNDQRRLLAVKVKSLCRKTLLELTTIVTPDRFSAGTGNLWLRSGTTAGSASPSGDHVPRISGPSL